MEDRIAPIRLSQGHLQLLETCPPQFQRVYREQLRSPVSAKQYDASRWGNRFHLVMQQRAMGLPTEALFATEPELGQAIAALEQALPQPQKGEERIWQAAEHTRSLRWGTYLLTTVYDFIIAERSRAQIYDWKTYQQPKNCQQLAHHWQTRLYLYVLAETTDYAPQDLSMTYWFVELPQRPSRVTLSYSAAQHEHTQQVLARLLEQLDHWLNETNRELAFPHRLDCEANCPHARSWRSPQPSSSTPSFVTPSHDWLDPLTDIEEVIL